MRVSVERFLYLFYFCDQVFLFDVLEFECLSKRNFERCS